MTAESRPDIPELLLERFRLNELPRDEAVRIEQRLKTDADLQERLDALERSDDEIARQYPDDWLAQRVRALMPVVDAADERRPGGVRRFAIASALAAAALVAIVALPWGAVSPAADDNRVKGGTPSLTVYRHTPQGSETLADGARARAGDLLRVGYVSGGRGYGVILSIDGRGIVTLHLPPDGGRAASLRGGGTILLDNAYELDDAPAWERFYFVTGAQAFDVAPVMDAARRAAAGDRRTAPASLPVSRELVQSTFSLQKEVRP